MPNARFHRFFASLIAFCFIAGGLRSEPASAESASAKTSEAKKETKKSAKRRTLGPISTGLFYGNYLAVDDADFRIIVQGLPPNQGQKTFYLDKATRFYLEKKKRGTLKDFPIGSRVAVRYFAESRIAVAKHVFLVVNEFFQAKDYVIRIAKKPAAEAAKKPAGGH